MGKRRHVAIERQLERFKNYCEVYWDLMPQEVLFQERDAHLASGAPLLPIGSSGSDTFYPAFLGLRCAIYSGRVGRLWFTQAPPFDLVWRHYASFYRQALYTRAKRARRRQRRHDSRRRSKR